MYGISSSQSIQCSERYPVDLEQDARKFGSFSVAILDKALKIYLTGSCCYDHCEYTPPKKLTEIESGGGIFEHLKSVHHVSSNNASFQKMAVYDHPLQALDMEKISKIHAHRYLGCAYLVGKMSDIKY